MSNTIATLDVKVQMKGTAAGTLGWFKELIEDSELIIKKTRDGIPGMFLHEKHKKDGTERKENEGNTFICHPETKSPQDEGYNLAKINGIGYDYVVSSGNDEQKYIFGEDICFTSYPLTPACQNAVDEFIKSAVEKFAEWYEKQ